MTNELTNSKLNYLEKAIASGAVPSIIVDAGGDASKRYLEFFAAQIRNRNTREAYMRAVRDFFQ